MEEAHQALGLVSRVVRGSRAEVVAAALEFAVEVAGKSPMAVAGIKYFVVHALDYSCAYHFLSLCSGDEPCWLAPDLQLVGRQRWSFRNACAKPSLVFWPLPLPQCTDIIY